MIKLLRREAIIAACILVATLIVVYPAAYYAGSRTLGAFGEAGTLGAWMASLFAALADGNAAIWFFTLSPLLAVSVLRAGIAAARRI